MIIDDKHIILKIRECLEQGFRLLLGKYKETVYWHIRRLVVSHEDAQDATQETFVRIFRNFNKYQEQIKKAYQLEKKSMERMKQHHGGRKGGMRSERKRDFHSHNAEQV